MRTQCSRRPWLLTISALVISCLSSASVARLSGQQASAVSSETSCPENEPGLFHACALARGRSFDPPRTPDGRPDFQGWWQSPLGGTQNIEEHARTPAMPAGKSLIVDPASGKIPYQPWAAAQITENAAHFVEPNAACFPSGSPRSIYTPGGFQLRQSAGYVVFLFDRAHNYRIVPTDGRPPLGGNLTLWQGDARGRWDDSTLVVDIVNQNSRTWLDQQGRFGTASLHVIERFTLLDADTLHFEATIEDDNVYTRPWTIAFPVKRNKQRARTEFIEDACFEGDETAQMLLDLGYRIFPGIQAAPQR